MDDLLDSMTMVGDAGFHWPALLFAFECLGYVVAALAITAAFKRYLDWRTTNVDDDHLIEVSGNGAFALQRGSLYLALLLGMAGSRLAPRANYAHDISVFIVDGVVVAVVLAISCWLTDKYLLRRIANLKELVAGNWAVAVVEASAYTGLGLIFNGAFAGEGGGLGSAVQFAVIGQVVFALIYMIRDYFLAADVEAEVAAGNVGAALETGGFLLAMAIIQRASIIGPFEGWWTDVFSYLETQAVGLLIMALATVVIDVAFLRRTSLRGPKHHGNLAASMMVAAISVGTAIVVAVSI